MTDLFSILFVAPSLGGGGAERALVNIINQLDRDRFEPHLALFQKEGVFLEELAPDVPVYGIQPTDRGFLHRNWIRLWAFKQLYARLRPALVMSVLWQANAITLLSANLWRFHIPLVINEQTAPRSSLRSDSRRRLLWPVTRGLYRQASHIVVISQGIAAELGGDLCISAAQMSVIHNPVAVAQIIDQAGQPVDFRPAQVPFIVAAGRLVPLKNYQLLLHAMQLVLQQQDVALYILGEGPERTSIENLAASLGISDHVHLLGFQPNPYPYVAQADLFVLSSDHEGFGNVLVEAMALGVPVISTDCPYGPREILADGRYGLLVPPDDERAMAEAILTSLQDPVARQRFATAGRERAKDFSMESVVASYERLFQNLIEGRENAWP